MNEHTYTASAAGKICEMRSLNRNNADLTLQALELQPSALICRLQTLFMKLK